MKSLLSLGISEDDRARLLRGLHEGKYNLLLGAGASYGCKGGDGVELKDGETLSKEIASEFELKLNDAEMKKLPLTYEEADSTNKSRLKQWLRNRFLNCQPTWQHLLFRIHWQRIWTFNIDDVLEKAFYIDQPNNVFKEYSSFDWKERVTPLEITPNTLQVVHLHGRASDLGGKLDGLVFSVSEYSGATRGQQQWHASFQTHYLESPFVVCGASLAEEVDLAEAIRTKNLSNAIGFPSFIVSHGLDDGQKQRMRRFNLVPVVCPLDEFFAILNHELNEYRKVADAVVSRLKPGTYERFLAQFRRLDIKDTSKSAIEGTDFYGGDEPTWNDILNNLDTIFKPTARAASILDEPTQRFAVLMHGDSVSGKSVSLLRIASIALRKGFKPFWFRHEEGFSAEIAADYLSEDDKAVLLIDDAANYLEAIGKVLQDAKNSGLAARFFLTLRSPRLRGFRIDVNDEFRREYRLGKLFGRDLVGFVQRRRKASRLGKHIGKTDSKIIKELDSKCRSELLESLSYIEFAEPIKQRVRRILVETLTTPTHRAQFARVICVHRFGFSLPLRVALSASGLQFKEFQVLIGDHLKAEGILVRDERGIRLRHRILSEYAWTDLFSEDERYDAMSAVVGALAPLVNTAVIKAKGLEHLILREILDQAQVSTSIGSKALTFYEEHEPALGWSSRYWDQRALLESRIGGHFSKAYSYSQKAISLEKHPFAFTSLGTICMTYCVSILDSNRIEAMKYFHEGEEALSTAWDLATKLGRVYEHPFIKFFASAAHMFRRFSPSEPEYEAVLQLYRVWLQRAEDSPVFSTSFGKQRLRSIKGTEMKATLRLQKERHTNGTGK
ncbi:SIR2 family protein [Pseudomonas aeruginosa]|uniref:SIR2 family protein n=1 Tax=Pseudomonas aeruginosa TaxID=287 RepID=UPI0021A8E6B7|nr:SIR2 family protein [Pseudomonas aeruginosa]MCT2412788.1 SIR2 family protein [Pseudomonas aeruginosa]